MKRRACTYLPLGGEVAVSGGNTQEKTIVFGQDGWIVQDGDIGGLWRGVHFRQDFVGQRLGELV